MDDEKLDSLPNKEESNDEPANPVPQEEEVIVDNEDVFLDDVRAEEDAKRLAKKQEEEKVASSQKKEETSDTDLHIPEEEVEKIPEAEKHIEGKKTSFVYADDRLQGIENARQVWLKNSKFWRNWKIVISIIAMVLIVVCYVIPAYAITEPGQIPLYLTLAAAIVSLVGIFVFNFFKRRAEKEAIHNYFESYYQELNSYTLSDLGVTDIVGDVDTKIDASEFTVSKLYGEVKNVGSRENLTFTYKGMECGLADAAVQSENGRAVQTLFVGKYLRTKANLDVDQEGLVLYFKGNKRAIPPVGLKDMHLLEDHKRYALYGSAANKKILTSELRSKLTDIRTDNLLVDVAISIQSDRIYWALGYEDTLMILPSDSAFDPKYVMAFKKNLSDFLELAYWIFSQAE